MEKYIITTVALTTLLIGSVTFTACEDVDDIHELSLNHLLSPANLIGKINSKVDITASWDAMGDATAYIIEFYKEDPSCEDTPILSEIIGDTEFTKEGLEGETEYTIWVKSIAEGLNDSKWNVISRTTEVIEQILKTIEDTNVNDKTTTIKQAAEEAVTELQLSWVDKSKRVQKATLRINEAKVAAGQKMLTDLIPSTTYGIRIKSGRKTHSIRTFTIEADLTIIIQVRSGDDLTTILDNAREGAYIAIMDNAKYTIYAPDDGVKTYALNKSLTVSGYYSSNKPTIEGCITTGSSAKALRLSNIILSGEKKTNGLLIMGKDPTEVETFKTDGCNISDYKDNVINNESKVDIDSIIIQNNTINNIDRDVMNICGGKLKLVEVSACTFNSTVHTFLRNSSNSIATISFTQYTFYKVCHLDNKDSNGLFLMNKTTDDNELIVKQCLFYNIGIEKLGDSKYVGTWTRSSKMKASGTYTDNYYYDGPNLWTNSKYAEDYSMVVTEVNPQFIDTEDGNFIVGNKELVGDETGDPRWLE